ncbi:hypothetical protein PHMEG_00038146, partial [Phytophthora megakarya]
VSPQTLLSEAGYTQSLSAGRNSDDAKEEGPDMDLEEKPHTPPQAPSGAPADCDESRDPPDEAQTARAERTSSTNTPPTTGVGPKKKKPKSGKKKLKAPDSDAEDHDERTWTEEDLAQIFHKKDLFAFLLEDPVMKILRPTVIGELHGPTTPPTETSRQLEAATQLLRTLKDAGIMPGAFSASKLFDLETTVIHRSATLLYNKLEPLVGSVALPETIKRTPVRSPEYQTGSSQYASATSEAGSDSSVDLERMTLGPSGAAMLQDRQANAKLERSSRESTPVVTPARSPVQMQTFFNAAMNRYLKEKQTGGSKPTAGETGQNVQDVEMESVESYHDLHDEYDPDNLSIDTPRQAVVAGPTSTSSTMTPRIRVSAISELKEYSGKDQDEDRARSWLGKVKSAFVRDQAPDSEKCLVLGDLLTGPARNWYRQLSRSTRSNWKSLLEAFQTQYCGRGVSVARQY